MPREVGPIVYRRLDFHSQKLPLEPTFCVDLDFRMMFLSSVVILDDSGTFCEKIFITGHTRNLIARTCPICITSTWPFDIPLKKTHKIFADLSIPQKFERMIANE